MQLGRNPERAMVFEQRFHGLGKRAVDVLEVSEPLHLNDSFFAFFSKCCVTDGQPNVIVSACQVARSLRAR